MRINRKKTKRKKTKQGSRTRTEKMYIIHFTLNREALFAEIGLSHVGLFIYDEKGTGNRKYNDDKRNKANLKIS